MTERIGISLVLLIVAMAHLLTDVVRLALEVAPRPGINAPTPVPARSTPVIPPLLLNWMLDRRSPASLRSAFRLVETSALPPARSGTSRRSAVTAIRRSKDPGGPTECGSVGAPRPTWSR